MIERLVLLVWRDAKSEYFRPKQRNS